MVLLLCQDHAVDIICSELDIFQSLQVFPQWLLCHHVEGADRGEGLPGLGEEAGEGKSAEREQDCKEDARLEIQEYNLS